MELLVLVEAKMLLTLNHHLDLKRRLSIQLIKASEKFHMLE